MIRTLSNPRGTLCLALSAVTFFAARVSYADPADDAFKAGAQAFNAGRYQEAEQRYEEAFRLRPSPDVAANLAQAEIELGKKTEAAEHLSYAIRLMPGTTKPEVRAAMEKGMSELRKSLCELTIDVNIPGAALTIGARKLGSSPLPAAVFVEPGNYVVRGERAEYANAEVVIAVSAGMATTVKILLKRTDGNTRPGKAVWPIAVLGSVAAAGLALGIAGVVLNRERFGDAEDAQEPVPDHGCGANGEACPDIADSLSQGNTFLGMGIAGFSVAGAAGIAAIVYAVLPGGKGETEPKTGLRLVPMFGAANGLLLEGRF